MRISALPSSLLKHCGRTDRGAALVEFALSLPLILLFVGAIYDLGRVQSQINTIAQVAYQIAFVGATTPRVTGDTTMDQEGAKILSLVNRETSFFNAAPVLQPIPSGQTTRYFQDANRWYVTSTVQGSVDSYFKAVFPPLFTISVSVTTPYLYNPSFITSDTINGYQNPTTLSDCSGTLGGYSSANCNSVICGCPEGTSPNTCLGSNTPRICYNETEPS